MRLRILIQGDQGLEAARDTWLIVAAKLPSPNDGFADNKATATYADGSVCLAAAGLGS